MEHRDAPGRDRGTRLRILATTTACLLIAASEYAPASAQPPDKVRVDLAGDAAPALALLMARDADFYARENLQVFVVGKGRAQEISGPHLRLWHAGLADVIVSNRESEDLRLFAITNRRLNGVAASIILIEEKRDILLRFLRATIEGNYLARTDAPRAKKVLARDAGLKGARAIEAGYRDFQAQSPPDMEISIAEVGNVLKANKLNLNADAYVDDSFVPELRKAGFIETLRKKYGTL